MRIIIPIQPVPKARMTQRSKYASKAARKTIDYQNEIADRLKYEYRVPDFEGEIELNLLFFVRGNRGDRLNFAKAIEDAIQRAGIVKNDKQITKGQTETVYGSNNPRIIIEIKPR